MSEENSASGGTNWITSGIAALMAVLGTMAVAPALLNGPKGVPEAIVGIQPTVSEEEQHHVRRMRSVLYDFLGVLPPPIDKPASDAERKGDNKTKETETEKRVREAEAEKRAWDLDKKLRVALSDYSLEFLVMTVADPIDTQNNYFFDHQLDALQKALTAEPHDTWLYSGCYLPWQAFKDRRKIDSKISIQRRNHWYQDEPGVLLFRLENDDEKGTRVNRMLLVYLVGELPTIGVQRDALDHAIHEIACLDHEINGPRQEALTIPIVAPTFSGSAYSLKEGLKSLLANKFEDKPGDVPPGYHSFRPRIINGSATAVPQGYFDEFDIPGDDSSGYLGALVASFDENERALRSIVNKGKTAWLVETGTSFSSNSTSEDSKYRSEEIIIPYPVGISRVRSSFEQQLTASRNQSSIKMPIVGATSQLPFDPDETVHDMPPMQTTEMTSPSIELLLNQISALINSSDIHFVCILASEVRDTIFLAEMLKIRCPNVQLLAVEPDILLTHESFTDSIRGSIIASSYPLFTEGVEACRRGARVPIMGGETQYGIYNAVLLHRGLLRKSSGLTFNKTIRQFSIADGLKYPFNVESLAGLFHENEILGPRVWLHTVGYNSFYPWGTPDALSKDESRVLTVRSEKWKNQKTRFNVKCNPACVPAIVGMGLVLIGMAWGFLRPDTAGDWFRPFGDGSLSFKYHWRVFLVTAVVLMAAMVLFVLHAALIYLTGCAFLARDTLTWINEAHVFSGVTLLLPHLCACSSVIIICYLKLRQSFLVSEGRTKERGATNEQQTTYSRLWTSFGQVTFGTGAALVLALSGYAWYLWLVFSCTRDVSGKSCLFWWTWCTMAAGYLLWWIALLELHIFQRQLRNVMKTHHLPPGDPPSVLKTIHEQGLRGVYQVLVGPGPTPNDLVSYFVDQNNKQLAVESHRSGHPFFKQRAADKTVKTILENDKATLETLREVQYRLLVIRNQVSLLALGAVLLFGAVVSYPFTSAAMWRSLAISTVIALAASISLCFSKLEKDEHLSRLLGTKPNEIEWNWNNTSVFVSAILGPLLLLLSQSIPGSWSVLGQVIGPILKLGK